jgi:hypothetical protein
MTVKELLVDLVGEDEVDQVISLLQDGIMPDTELVMSEDGEGNDFDTVNKVEQMMYRPDWREVKLIGPLTDELSKDGYGEEDVVLPDDPDWQLALVIYP